MHKVLGYLMLSAALISSAAWAQDEGITERSVSEVTRGVFDSPLTVSPRAGSLGFRNADGAYNSKLVAGLTLNWTPTNFMTYEGIALGLESGLMVSHIGSPGSNFVGQNDAGGSGANSYLFPINISAGYQFNGNMLAALNFGATGIYRTVSSSMQLGRASDANTGDSVEFFPNVGFTLGWAPAKFVGISLRGEYIPVPATSMYTATLGATFPIA